jgi:hypothetical protein
MKQVKLEYRDFFTQPRLRSLCVAFFILAISLVLQFYASAYSTRSAGHFVGDFFLDNLPTINLNPIIIEGALWTILMSLILILLKPKYLLFTMKTASVFIVTRSFFVAVTHLGIYPDQVVPSTGFFDHLYLALNLQAGYFFSAHTGLPFLLALIFWDEKPWRYFYFTVSLIFGISVLLTKIHYSIDVFAAPFMTYSIYKMSRFMFAEDYRIIGSTTLS